MVGVFEISNSLDILDVFSARGNLFEVIPFAMFRASRVTGLEYPQHVILRTDVQFYLGLTKLGEPLKIFFNEQMCFPIFNPNFSNLFNLFFSMTLEIFQRCHSVSTVRHLPSQLVFGHSFYILLTLLFEDRMLGHLVGRKLLQASSTKTISHLNSR